MNLNFIIKVYEFLITLNFKKSGTILITLELGLTNLILQFLATEDTPHSCTE